MFFFLSKVLGALTSPLTWIIILLGFSFYFKNKKLKSRLKTTAFILLLFFTNPFISNSIIKWWEINPLTYKEVNRHEYGVLLTGVTNIKATPSDRTHYQKGVDRVLHTIELYKKGLIRKILVTGGSGSVLEPHLSESQNIKRTLLIAEIPEEDIILEEKARNTAENAIYSREIISESDKIILITSAFHMRRAKACFVKQGFEPTPFTVDFYYKKASWAPDDWLIPNIKSMKIWQIFIKELLGYLAYSIKGYI